MFSILFLILVALAFEYVNGFHDAANAIATSVATKVLTARQAVTMAATCDLLGALTGTAVATTIATGLVEERCISLALIFSALLAAISWNLLTWWLGLPSSSSHALIGGLCGAALAASGGDWQVIKWSVVDPATHKTLGLLHKVVLPMIVSPVCGSIIGFAFMGLLIALFGSWRPHKLNRVFGKLQIGSAAWMSFCHGLNDAQKTMAIIVLTLYTGTVAGTLKGLPNWLSFLKTPRSWRLTLDEFKEPAALAAQLRNDSDPATRPVSQYYWSQFTSAAKDSLLDAHAVPTRQKAVLMGEFNRIHEANSLYEPERFAAVNLNGEARRWVGQNRTGEDLVYLNRLLLESTYPRSIVRNRDIPIWVKVICAAVMGAGIASGGWRIIRTMGSKLVRLQPIHGFAAQTAAATTINVASLWGMPLSTTHVISTSIMGVGATKRLNAVKWPVMGRIVWAWVLTLPITFTLGFALLHLLRSCGWH